MNKSSAALRVDAKSIVIGEFYTVLDLDTNGEYTLNRDKYHPPYKVESIDEDRQVVVVQHSGVNPDTEEISFEDFGLIEGGSCRPLLTLQAYPILEALRGPRPSKLVDVRTYDSKALISGHNLLVPAPA